MIVYLGMDVGTSGVKAVLVNEAGAIVATASRELALSHPAPLWSEQDPDAWVDAAIAAVDESCRRASARDGAQVRGIGLSGQMHGATLLGADGRPLRPAILWNDGRSHAECAELERRCPSLHAIAGNLAMPGFTAPKLLWVARHEPEVFAKVAKVLLPKAYVRYRLTGEMVEDMSDAAGTLWLDVGRRALVRDDAASDRARSPPHAATGRRQRSQRGSLARLRAALGHGERMSWSPAAPAIAPRARSGSAPLRRAMRSCRSGRRACCSASRIGLRRRRLRPSTPSVTRFRGLWHQMGVMLSAAASLAWLSRILATPEAALLAPLGEAVERPSPVQFLPYLDGERTPHNDAAAAGAFVGLRSATGRDDIVQAVLEGVGLRRARQSGRAGRRQFGDRGGRSRRRRLALGALGADHAPTCSAFPSTASRRARSAQRSARRGSAGSPPPAKTLRKCAAVRAGSRASCRAPRQVAAYDEAYRQWRKLYPALKECSA